MWYFYPRRYRGKSPKWSRHYIGPFLITREIPPCNFVIQKNARSKPLVAHSDKLKLFLGDPPKAWINVTADAASERLTDDVSEVSLLDPPTPRGRLRS